MKYLFCLVLMLCCSCNPQTPTSVPQYEKDADALTARVAKTIREETGLKLIGTGGGMMGCIYSMAMSFIQYGELSMEEGRELLVHCVEEYLDAINKDEKIRPHLNHYPYTSKGVEIRIFIYQTDRRNPPIGSLSVVAAVNGRVSYDVQQEGLPSIKEVHEESYEEAKKLVELSSS